MHILSHIRGQWAVISRVQLLFSRNNSSCVVKASLPLYLNFEKCSQVSNTMISFFYAILLLVLLPFVASGNIQQIETASNGIAQIIDFCTEKFSTRFTLAIASKHPDLMRIAERVLRISNSSYIVEKKSLTAIGRNDKSLSGYESQIFLTYGNTIDIPKDLSASNIFLTILFTYEAITDITSRHGHLKSNYLSQKIYRLFLDSGKNLILSKTVEFSKESCEPTIVMSNFSYILNSWSVKLEQMFRNYDEFYGCPINIHMPPRSYRFEFGTSFLNDIFSDFCMVKHINCSLTGRSEAPQLILILVTNRYWSSLTSSQELKLQLIPVNFMRVTFYVTLAEKYTYFDKLILPFDGTHGCCSSYHLLVDIL